MAHQVCPTLVDVELLFNHVQNIQHVFFAHLTHFRLIGDGLSTGVGPKSTPCGSRSALRSSDWIRICPVGAATVPARHTNRDAIPASRVIAHRSAETVDSSEE